jgi:hypothetical protein
VKSEDRIRALGADDNFRQRPLLLAQRVRWITGLMTTMAIRSSSVTTAVRLIDNPASAGWRQRDQGSGRLLGERVSPPTTRPA